MDMEVEGPFSQVLVKGYLIEVFRRGLTGGLDLLIFIYLVQGIRYKPRVILYQQLAEY